MFKILSRNSGLPRSEETQNQNSKASKADLQSIGLEPPKNMKLVIKNIRSQRKHCQVKKEQ